MPSRIIVVRVGRSARTGRFVTLRTARRWPSTTVVETMRIRVKRTR